MGPQVAIRREGKANSEISQRVVEKIAEAEGVAPTELEAPLYDVIEPDALNELFHPQGDSPSTDGVVSFVFYGYEITVCSDSSVELDEI